MNIQNKTNAKFRKDNYLLNTFLGSTFLKTNDPRLKEYKSPGTSVLNNLSCISALYIYTNPAPHGYGSPAPKIAETVIRADGYNLKSEESRTTLINGRRINWPIWEDDSPFPFNSIVGNFHPGMAHGMFKRFLKNNFSLIKEHAERAIEDALTTNSDVLTRGRQTFDCLKESSVSSSQAYQMFSEIIKNNLGKTTVSCAEWIQCFFELMGLDKLKTIKKEKRHVRDKKVLCRYTKQIRKKSIYKTRWVKTTIEGNENVREYVFQLGTTFCGYIKHGERAKLNRRAIASPNIIKRMFLKIIEDFHLSLGKFIEGSTISVGGDEKKKKILVNLDSAGEGIGKQHVLQATQDATKFNECLTAEIFYMMHRTFFDDSVRKELKLQPCSTSEKLFEKICAASHWILANKKIKLGEGLTARNDSFYNRLEWAEENIPRMNSRTASWFTEALKFKSGDYLKSGQGMLMGMHNSASTTLGLCATGYNAPLDCGITCLRSSDDSMSIFRAPTASGMGRLIELDRKNLKALGINLSPDKTFFFDHKFGEYTSWFVDQGFISQYGVETAAMRPQGRNPHDDFHSCAKSIQTALVANNINPMGAELWIRVGIDNVRRLYKITRNKREGITHKCQLLSDGGPNLWDMSNVHLEETAYKESKQETEADKNYFLRINNPDNPFSGVPNEDITFSKESGELTVSVPEIPRNVFTYVKRSNRKSSGRKSDKRKEIETASAETVRIVNSVDLGTNLTVPESKTTIAEHLLQQLELSRADLTLNAEDEELFRRAVGRLTRGEEEITEDLFFCEEEEIEY